jgi:hypothetical protein
MKSALINADSYLKIARMYERVRLLINNDQFPEVEQLLKDHEELIVPNWKVMLELCVLSHDFISVHMSLRLIMDHLDPLDNYEVYKFVKNLDRVMEISGMYQIPSLVKAIQGESHFLEGLDYMRATRSQLVYQIEERMGICPLHQHSLSSHIGSH